MNAEINVWNPQTMAPDEFSLAQSWIAGLDNNRKVVDTIEAGIMVYIISSITFSFRHTQNIELLIISIFLTKLFVEKQVYYDLFHDFETHLFTFWTVRALIFDFLARTSHVYIVSFLRSLSLFFLFLISDSYQNTCCYNMLFSDFVQNIVSFLKSVYSFYIYFYHCCRVMDMQAPVATISSALVLFKSTPGLRWGQPSILIPSMMVNNIQ